MKAHGAPCKAFCWAAAAVLLAAVVTASFGYENKVEKEAAEADAPDTTAAAAVDSVPLPVFKQDSLATGTPAFPDSVPADSLQAGKTQEKPFYKKWWFVAAGGVAVALIAIAFGGGGEAEEDLPGFPDPPDR